MDGAKIFFSHMVKARIFFFGQNQGQNIFFKKTQAPPWESNGRSLKLSIMLNNDKRGPGFWKFNCSLLRDPEYVNMVKKIIRNTIAIEIDQHSFRALEKIKAIIQIWDKRYLTLFGKVMILNSFIISQLIYLLSVLPAPPKNTMTQINKLIFEFMWNGKPDRIKRNIMILAKEHGGMAVPDIMMKNIALKVAWVQRIVTTEAKWKSVISTHIPINLDIFWKCNMKENDVHMVTNKFRNTFVKEIIQSWFDYSYYNPSDIDSIRCQVIWFNSHIKVNNCTIFNKLMYDNGIIYIHQL